MHPRMNDAGSYIKSAFSSINTDVTAAGTGDATEVDGAWVDRAGHDSVKVVIVYTATLGQDETLSFAANLQDATSSAGAGADDFGTALASTVVATGGAGGSTETGTVELDFDVTGCNQYVRVQFTPDLSAGATDTANISSAILLVGGVEEPVSASLI